MLSLEMDGADVWNIYADALDAAHGLFVSLDTTARLNRVVLARNGQLCAVLMHSDYIVRSHFKVSYY